MCIHRLFRVSRPPLPWRVIIGCAVNASGPSSDTDPVKRGSVCSRLMLLACLVIFALLLEISSAFTRTRRLVVHPVVETLRRNERVADADG